ncbi:sigma-70 family RNA polymerase sigma factor [Geminocystis sp. NIES-3709]|uniref:sigma-70 family RNA polymerase sigma factor n=1 Tax=Geminocystis sp. NIES-3709 TaxID=1617448 RepID=UPI0005FC96FA|nr:sigma-70 family RNA polymerase sigma factor [Geminocystis sp. NIES-3709]BAQ64163.1 hypothetical protein GM3709_928 [Geminocystis sp. NIES-3709]
MKMQKRTNLVTQFSSFLCLKEESSSLITYWKNTPELERNMELLIKQQIIPSEEDIVAQEFLQWLKKEQDNFKYRHLVAYLQESCFFATQKVYQRLRSYWDLFTWQDYFQWANLLVSSPIQLLSNYDTQFKSKLTTYARNKLENQLIDQAYLYMGWDRASDWGLLRKLSITNQRKCLQQIGGLKDNNLEQYLFVWQCFNLIYRSKGIGQNKMLPSPSQTQFIQVSNEYNFLISNKEKFLPSLTSSECEKILLKCVNFARQYCNPRMIKIEEDVNNLTNNIELNFTEETDDRQEEYELVNEILASTFTRLEMPQKILFQLWKGLQLTQTEIVQVMELNYPDFVNQQFQVAREISFVRQCLLEKLVDELLIEKQISLTRAIIVKLKQPLDHWLQEHCKQLLWKKISDLYQSFSSEEQNYIQQYLIKHNWIVNDSVGIDIQNSIASRFKNNISEEYKLVFPDTKHIEISFIHLIEEWINNSTYSLINNN